MAEYTYDNAAGYVRVCTDSQLENVIKEEKTRIKRFGPDSDVTKCAKILLRAAKREQTKRIQGR